MNAFVAAIGFVALLMIALGIGMSMDTEAQRREANRLAEERRLRGRERTAARPVYYCPDCPWRPRR